MTRHGKSSKKYVRAPIPSFLLSKLIPFLLLLLSFHCSCGARKQSGRCAKFMKSPKKFSMVRHVNNDRSPPFFDNHYGNGVLIENWQEGRIYDACGRKFTLAMDNSVGPKRSTYTSDYTNPGRTLLQPMMRRRGLGKALIFGEGNSTIFKSEPTSTTYGETQRHLIDSRYGTSHRAKDRLNNTMGGLSRQNFKGTTMPKTLKPTADEELYGNFSTTKTAMDLPIECFHFQRQMAYNEMTC